VDLDITAGSLSTRCSAFWLRSIPRLRIRIAELSLRVADVPRMLERAREHALCGQKGRAANWLAVASILDQPRTLVWLRREGLLRASKYQFDPTVPRFLLSEILTRADDLALHRCSVVVRLCVGTVVYRTIGTRGIPRVDDTATRRAVHISAKLPNHARPPIHASGIWGPRFWYSVEPRAVRGRGPCRRLFIALESCTPGGADHAKVRRVMGRPRNSLRPLL
jgi:hypothetical protein